MRFTSLASLLLLPLCLAATSLSHAATDSSAVLKWRPVTRDLKDLKEVELLEGLGANTRATLLNGGTVDNIDDLATLLRTLIQGPDSTRLPDSSKLDGTYLLHVVKWKTSDHKSSINHWYLYDGKAPGKPRWLALSDTEWLERSFIPGRKLVFLVSLQLPAADPARDPEKTFFVKGAVTYSILVTRRQPQFVSDLSDLIRIIAAPLVEHNKAAKEPPTVAYAASYPINTAAFPACSINITAANNAGEQVAATAADAGAAQPADPADGSGSAVSYINEAPTWRGLSFAVPVTGYKDLTFDASSGTLKPKSVTRQSLYACLDLYIPRDVPGLQEKRYLPHPFVGLPITGKVLQHPMAGLAIGYRGIDVFAAAVYDLENKDASGDRHPVWKATCGIKISIGAGKAALSTLSGK